MTSSLSELSFLRSHFGRLHQGRCSDMRLIPYLVPAPTQIIPNAVKDERSVTIAKGDLKIAFVLSQPDWHRGHVSLFHTRIVASRVLASGLSGCARSLAIL